MIRAAAADRTTSYAERVPAVRARADLTAVRQRWQGRTDWIVKNPLSLEYFRLPDEEYFLLRRLDGVTPWSELKRAFEQQFAPQTIDFDELGRYAAQLHRNGLAVSAAPGQGMTLDDRGRKRRRRSLLERFGNPLAIRFRGVDPEPFFNWLYPQVRWFFTPTCVGLCMTLMLAALLTVATRFDRFLAALPTFHEFFTPENAFWLLVTAAVVKVLHEFGHGLTCKHFGGECHELGAMLLCFTPTLYCNVSDSWLLPNKRHRAAIGAAGIYVELILASIAVFVWRWTEPGLLHTLALNVVFLCSVSTLIFNANPLLRYDGYYIAGDLLEITNLGSKASEALRRVVGRVCLGLRYEADVFGPQRHTAAFAAYAVASSVYRAVVFVSILWFLNKYFEPYRLDVIGQTLGLVALFGLVADPVRRLTEFFSVPGRMAAVNKLRLTTTAAILGGMLFAAFAVPLPHRIYAPLELQPRDAQAVYIETPGTLDQILVKPGDMVAAGQPLAQLANLDLALEVDSLVGRRDEAKVVLASLHQRQFTDAAADVQIKVAEQTSAALEQLVERRLRDGQRLVPKAPAAGTVLPPPVVPPHEHRPGELTPWSGSPLDPKNAGCTLEPGTMLCRIGDPKRMEAVLFVDQGDVEFLALNQEVEVMLHELPGRVWRGTIREIAKTDLKTTPRDENGKGSSAGGAKEDRSGAAQARRTSYQVRVLPLDDPDGLLRIGLSGRAKISAGRQTLATAAARAFAQTFRFEW